MDKVQDLTRYTIPTPKQQVQIFLGLAGYYHHFIPRFAMIMAPLTDRLCKASPRKIAWSRECEKAFQELQGCLSQEMVLIHSDFSEEFIIQTDTSGVGLGPYCLITDHALLKWLQAMKDTNPSIMRWYLALHLYDFTISHRDREKTFQCRLLLQGREGPRLPGRSLSKPPEWEGV